MTSLLKTRPATPHKPRTTAPQPRRIVLIEDHPVVSSGLSALLNYEPDLQVCGIAQDFAAAIEMIDALSPDLIISDICLKGQDGLALLKDIKVRAPGRRVLMLSMHDESLYAARALRAGASGYVRKEEDVETLLTAIHKVLKGEIYLSPPTERKLLRQVFARKPGAPAADPLETLTDRELEVFLMIGQAKSTREIAAELDLSVKTIESYRAHLKKKLNLAKGGDLLSYALSRQKGEAGVERRTSDEVESPSWPVAVACRA